MFNIYLKKAEGNEIQLHKNVGKIIETATLTIQDGFVKIGKHYLPICNILFIEEII